MATNSNYFLLPLGAGLLLFTAYLIVNETIRWRARVKGIGGPRGLPLVGNIPQVLASFSAEQYRKWSKTFGPVYQVQLGNRPVIIVNTVESAKALFLTQTSALVSRPLFYIFHGVVSKNIASIGTSPWSESCKNRRKLAAGALNRVKVQSYEPLVIRETKDFIDEVAREANNGEVDFDFEGAVKRLSLNIVLSLNYGTRVSDTKDLTADKFYVEVIEVEEEISRLRSTSKNLANYIPLLRVLEPALSRLGLQKSSAHSAQIGQRRIAYNRVLFDGLRERIKNKTDSPCIQGNIMKDPESVILSPNELMSISLSMMAGSDSTQPTIAWAILFLAHNPGIQKKAYEAIRNAGALGSNYGETPDVPYITAFTKEVLRFYSALPLAMPRETTTSAVYGGMVIPKGTMVFLNVWACNRDEAAFATPWEFYPERWLDHPDKHVHQFAFGYGSRMCVASHLAFRLVYSVLLQLIAHFEIRPGSGQSKDVADPIKGLADGTALTLEPSVRKARFVRRNL